MTAAHPGASSSGIEWCRTCCGRRCLRPAPAPIFQGSQSSRLEDVGPFRQASTMGFECRCLAAEMATTRRSVWGAGQRGDTVPPDRVGNGRARQAPSCGPGAHVGLPRRVGPKLLLRVLSIENGAGWVMCTISLVVGRRSRSRSSFQRRPSRGVRAVRLHPPVLAAETADADQGRGYRSRRPCMELAASRKLERPAFMRR